MPFRSERHNHICENIDGFHEHIHESDGNHHRHYEEFQKYHKYFKVIRPFIVITNLVVWYLLFRYVGIKSISIFFALFIITKGVLELFFFWRLEKRIFKPIDKLKNGLDEIAKGNYNVKVEFDDKNVISLLLDSFNDMALKLQESERIKSEYEENRKTLLANISHDLKTPITSIQGYIEIILEENTIPPETTNKYLRTIYNNTVYINKLIDDLFLFSKLDMDKIDFNFENLPIGAFMNDLMEEFKFDLEEKGYDFKYINKIENECLVNIDRKRIYQAFNNVIGNAIRYGSENDLSICIEMYKQGDFVYIDFNDNGLGIPEDKLPYIFDRFYRIDNERSKDFISTGLGLAITKELVEAHGGKITASSIEKEGTCITIILPIA
jgi:signal transduction histidine kinase